MHELHVTLEDLYKGKTSKLAVQRNIICSKCTGFENIFSSESNSVDQVQEKELPLENAKHVMDVVFVLL